MGLIDVSLLYWAFWLLPIVGAAITGFGRQTNRVTYQSFGGYSVVRTGWTSSGDDRLAYHLSGLYGQIRRRSRYWYDWLTIPAAPPLIIAVEQVTETDLAQIIGRLKTQIVAQVTETSLAQVMGRLKTVAVAQTFETDFPQVVGRLKARAVGQTTETDLAQEVTKPGLFGTVGRVLETNLAQAVGRLKVRLLDQVAEIDLAQAVSWAPKSRFVGQVVETNFAQEITAFLAGAGAGVMRCVRYAIHITTRAG